jgi:hypothetical protein
VQAISNIFAEYLKSPGKYINIKKKTKWYLRIIRCILNGHCIITTKEFIYCSYRIEQAVIPFQSAELSNEIVIYKRLVHAIDIHHKGMESVFIVKYRNIGVININ